MGEVVGDQIANQAVKPLKKGGKKEKRKKNHQFWNRKIAGSLICSVTSLVSSPVCGS
jgi:hypothetical protein